MVFLDRPAEDPSELFDREEELARLRQSALSRGIILVLGLRRTGKTSLVKAGTRGLDRIYLDARRFETMGYITYADFLGELAKSINEILPLRRRMLEFLSRVSEVSIAGVRIALSPRPSRSTLPSLLDSLNEWAGAEGTHLVIVVDEAQELARMRGFNLLPILAYVYDNLRNISLVLTGSKVGMLYSYLRLNDPSSPLYGRYMEVIELKPFSRGQSLEFLTKGFNEAGSMPSGRLIEEAVDRLNGIVGWLSLFGLTWLRTRRDDVLEEVIKIASGIVREEFCSFVKAMGSPRYITVLRAISHGATWSEVKRYLELKEGRAISDSEVTKLLKNLVNNGFVIKQGGEYYIADPVLKEIADELVCR